jgi:hypothetical protein
MRDRKQMVGWALLLAAASAIVWIAVPNIGFGETVNDFNNGSVQKITMRPLANYLEGRAR